MVSVATRAGAWARGLYLGWWVLLASMGVQMLTANFTMQSFGAYIAVMREEFGWSSTAFAAAFVIMQAGGGFLGPVVGWLLGRIGPRLVIRIGLVIFALGVMGLSLVNSLPTLYLCVAVVALGTSMSGFLPINTVAVQWFERWRSTALALMQTGISLGGLLVPLVVWSLEAIGWRATALVTGGIVLAVGLPLTFVIGNRPEDHGLQPDGAAAAPAAGDDDALAPVRRDFTAPEAMATRAFWTISFGHAIALMVVFAVLAHLVPFLSVERGYSLRLGGLIVAVMTSTSIAGQLAGGLLGDLLNKRWIATAAMFGHALALLMLAHGASLPWIVGFAVLHGFSWGLRGPVMQSLRADYFGRTHFGQIMGLSSVIVTLGIILGPLIASGLADAGGSFRLGFTVLAALAGLGSVFFILATPPSGRRSA